MNTIKNISSEDFINERISYNGFVILECFNENNAILKTMELIIMKLRNNLPVQFKHLRINTTLNPFIIEKFYVQKNPSYLIFYKGKFIDRIDGIVSFTDFERRINHNIIKYKIWTSIKVF